MPQCQSANADGEDGRDDARPVAKQSDRDGQSDRSGILAEDYRVCHEGPVTERAGVESDADPALAYI
jgi:hypothetical protein